MREAYHDQLDPIFDDLAEHLPPACEVAVRQATQALLTGDADDRRAGDQRRRRDRRRPASGSRTTPSSCSRCSSRSPATCGCSSPRCGWSASSSGWATCPCTSPRSPGCGCPTSRCPTRSAPTIERMAEVAEDMVRRVAPIIADRDVEAAIALGRTTRRWTSCAAAASPSCSPTTGRTASRRPSTSPCWAATTSGSPTTPCRWPAGSSSWSPASSPSRGRRGAVSDPGWRRPRPRPRRLGVEVRAAA